MRLALDKMPDRFHEHPHTVIAITNLTYADAPQLRPGDPPRRPGSTGRWAPRRRLGLRVLRADRGAGARPRGGLARRRPSPVTGNPTYVQPSVLVLYREDHEFLLDTVIPGPGAPGGSTTSSSPRSRGARACRPSFKAEKILAPLARSLRPGGRLLTIQS